MIKKVLILIACLFAFLLSFSQTHNPKDYLCVEYVYSPTGVNTFSQCTVCDKNRKAEFDAKAAKAKEESLLREKKIKEQHEQRQREAAIEKQDNERHKRDMEIQMAQLKAESSEIARMERLKNEEERKVRERFNAAQQKLEQEFRLKLEKQQESIPEDIRVDNNYWNEVEQHTNLIKFSVKTDKSHSYGFANKRNETIISPQYSRATNFYKGSAFVTYYDRENEREVHRIIDDKNKTLFEFTDSRIDLPNNDLDYKYTDIIYPDTISSDLVTYKAYHKGPRGRGWAKSVLGIMDIKGNVLTFPDFVEIGDFKNGTAIASKLVKFDDFYSKSDPSGHHYSRSLTHVEVGLIDINGQWVGDKPQKKLIYSPLAVTRMLYLTVSREKISYEEEKRYEQERENKRSKLRIAETQKIEAEFQRKIQSLKAAGYIFEEK